MASGQRLCQERGLGAPRPADTELRSQESTTPGKDGPSAGASPQFSGQVWAPEMNLGEPDSRVTIKHPPPTHSSALQVKPQQEKSLLTQKQSEPCQPPGPLSSRMKGFGGDAPSTGGVPSLVC